MEAKSIVEELPSYDADTLARMVVYPEQARLGWIDGRVLIRGLIDVRGNLVDIVVDESPHISLEISALNALSRLRFTPAKENGIPVAVWIQIPIIYMLN
jgi:protein TonB